MNSKKSLSKSLKQKLVKQLHAKPEPLAVVGTVGVSKKVVTKKLSARDEQLLQIDKKNQARKDQLAGAQFRWLNEQLYTIQSPEAVKLFTEKPDLFRCYHEGFRHQVVAWPVHPLDLILAKILKIQSKAGERLVVADMGCGDARLCSTLSPVDFHVHSFDLVSTNDRVVAADIAHVPLKPHKVNIVVFSLSLMGTNWLDFIKEANRILKLGGSLQIGEVVSRIENPDTFISTVESLGFSLVAKDLSYKMFSMFEFVKNESVKHTESTLALKPCVYKKRG